MCLSSVTWK